MFVITIVVIIVIIVHEILTYDVVAAAPAAGLEVVTSRVDVKATIFSTVVEDAIPHAVALCETGFPNVPELVFDEVEETSFSGAGFPRVAFSELEVGIPVLDVAFNLVVPGICLLTNIVLEGVPNPVTVEVDEVDFDAADVIEADVGEVAVDDVDVVGFRASARA